MKNHTFLLVGSMLFFGSVTLAQNTFPSEGNVGVGTDSPQESLEVVGNVKIDGLKPQEPSDEIGLRYVLVDRDGKLVPGPVLEINRPEIIINPGGGGPLERAPCVDKLEGRLNTGFNTFQLCSSRTLTDMSSDYGSFSLAFNRPVNFLDRLIIGYNGNGLTTSQVNLYPMLAVDGDAEINGALYVSTINATTVTANNFNFNSKLSLGNDQPTTGTTHANYLLSVDGKAVFKEAVVTVDNWSDFVFKEDYRLRSIEEVRDYITQNGHLPDVPSEQQVAEEGVSLGEMDAILLQKIEELTLYLIEVKEENEVLRKELESLR